MYVLKCEHVVMSAPSLINSKGLVWCPQCKEELRLTGIHVYEWHMSCKKCHYSRWTGLSESLSNQLAGAHSRTTFHETTVKYEKNPSAIKELERLRKAAVMLCTITAT